MGQGAELKKLIAFILIVLFTLMTVTAAKVRVCLWPENREVQNCLHDYFSETMELCKADVKPESTLMKPGDKRLMEMMCKSADAEVLVIPYSESIDGFSHIPFMYTKHRMNPFKKCTRVLRTICRSLMKRP